MRDDGHQRADRVGETDRVEVAIIDRKDESAQQRQQEGGDVSEVAALMEKIGPLLREGKVDEARALLKKAGELLKK